MENRKETIRIAELRGTGIYKRCRKQEHIFIDGIGLNDEEAIYNLKINLQNKVSTLRDYNFYPNFKIYNAERVIYDGYNTITRMLFPEHSEKTNCIVLPASQITN